MGENRQALRVYGRVSTLADFALRIVPAANGCMEWGKGRDKNGYGNLRFEGRSRWAHRVAWMLTNGPIPPGLCVLHRCDNPPCCNVDHLFLGTPTENMADRDAKGRQAKGERNGLRADPSRARRGETHPYAKLDPVKVSCIRERAAAGESGYNLAAEYGVTQPTISSIVRRKTWHHVP